MQSFGWYVRRVRSMGLKEIQWRLTSLVRDCMDVPRSRLGMIPRLDRTLLTAAGDYQPGFRLDPMPDDTAEPVELPDSKWLSELRDKAGQIERNRLSFLGLEDQFLGDPVQWHADCAAEKSGPMRHRIFVNYRDFDVFGDCKLVWEPNRHHQLVVLARCYRTTNDEKYARKIVDLIGEWRTANPFGYGMNWKSPMEVAIRNINWIAAIDLILRSRALDDESFHDIVQMIYVGTWDTVRRLSRGSSANNHLIGEAAGIFIACAYFPEFSQSAAWRAQAKKILEEEIQRQSSTDGCTTEHAFGYMFFVAQFLTLALIAGDRCGDPFSELFRKRLHQCYLFLAEICSDSGHPPNVGDSDDGYVLDLGDLPTDPAALITVGAELFDDPSLRMSKGSETAFWLFGAKPDALVQPKRDLQSKSFSASGYFLLRSGNTRDNEVSVFFDCAELGFGSIAAHGHADCLSFSLNLGGEEFFVDPGTYDYFSHPQWREYFRTTRAHNTVVVDGMCQSVQAGPFMWGARANALLLNWEDTDEITMVCGEHDGYARLSDPAIHRRSLILEKRTRVLQINDSILTAGPHTVERYLHLAPEVKIEQTDSHAVVVSRAGKVLVVRSEDGPIDVVRGSDSEFVGWVSSGYHRKSPSCSLIIKDRVSGDSELRLSINPID